MRPPRMKSMSKSPSRSVEIRGGQIRGRAGHVGLAAVDRGRVRLHRALGPQRRIVLQDHVAVDHEAGGVVLLEVAQAVVEEQPRRGEPAEHAAVAGVDQVLVPVVVEVGEVAVAREVDEAGAAAQDERAGDRRERGHPVVHAEVDPAGGRLVGVEALGAALQASVVDPPLVGLVARGRGVRRVHVEVAVAVEVDELDVAAGLVAHRQPGTRVVHEHAHGPALQAALVDPQPVAVVPVVAAVREHRVEVAVRVHVGEVDVLGRRAVGGAAGRDVGRVVAEALRGAGRRERERQGERREEMRLGDHGGSVPGPWPGRRLRWRCPGYASCCGSVSAAHGSIESWAGGELDRVGVRRGPDGRLGAHLGAIWTLSSSSACRRAYRCSCSPLRRRRP